LVALSSTMPTMRLPLAVVVVVVVLEVAVVVEFDG
jgi:hypothetical protein